MLRLAVRTMTVLVLMLLVFGATDPLQTGDGTIEKPFILSAFDTASLCWDAVPGFTPRAAGVKVQKPDDTVVLEIEINRSSPPPGVTWGSDATTEKVRIHELVKDMADGLYKMSAKVQSVSGVWSAWCAPVYIKKDWTPPPTPGGCFLSFR